jgi:predicted RNase H-like HicB family nuclease
MRLQIVLHTDEGGWVIAECPALPGCVSQGRTRQEALANVTEAAEGCIIARRELGLPVPDDCDDIEVAA